MLVPGRMTAGKFCGFLKRLLHMARRTVLLIEDGHPTHRAASVKRFVQTTRGRLRLFCLPPYSSELNPDELVWNLPSEALAGRSAPPEGERERRVPRVVITSSETHRQCPPIDFERFGWFPDFGLMDGTTWYGHSKLYVQTFACELGRRLLKANGTPDVAVFTYCPGAVRTGISREGGFAGKLMTAYFIDPKVAMWPAIYCATSRTLEGRSRLYLYLRHVAEADARSSDPRNGERLWQLSLEMLAARGIM